MMETRLAPEGSKKTPQRQAEDNALFDLFLAYTPPLSDLQKTLMTGAFHAGILFEKNRQYDNAAKR